MEPARRCSRRGERTVNVRPEETSCEEFFFALESSRMDWSAVRSVAARDSHTCAVNGQGIWCRGDNQFGQLGYESSENREDAAGDTHAWSRHLARVGHHQC